MASQSSQHAQSLGVPLAARTRSMARRASELGLPSSSAPRPASTSAAGPSRIPTASRPTRTSARVRGPGAAPVPVPSLPVGSKRKADDRDQRAKRHRPNDALLLIPEEAGSAPQQPPTQPDPRPDYADPALTSHAQPPATPSRAPAALASTTPVRTPPAQLSVPVAAPTPAREILGRNLDDAAAAEIQARPPTPPRIAERTPRNGYPMLTPKRPRSPQASDTGRLTVRRLDAGMVTASPGARRPVAPLRGPAPLPGVLFGVPATPAQPKATPRAIATMPKSRVMPSPFRVPGAGVTVPVPFGGRVGESTRASENKAAGSEVKSLSKSTSRGELRQPEQPRILAPVLEQLPVAGPAPLSRVLAPVLEQQPATPAPPPAERPGPPAPQHVLAPVLEVEPAPQLPVPPSIQITSVDEPMRDATADVMMSEAAAPEPEAAAPKRPPSALPTRRPSTRPSNAPAAPVAVAETPSVRRVPSYPSSLGSGAAPGVARTTARVVSNPLAGRSVSNPQVISVMMDVDLAPPRAVSDPSNRRSVSGPVVGPGVSRPRASLSMSTRREGWDDTSRNLTGLSDALAKLKVRLPAPGGTDSVRPGIRRVSNTSSSSSSSSNTPTMPDGKPKNLAHRPSLATLSARPVNPTAHNREPGDESFSVGDHSLASLCTSASVGTFLKGVVAFVDVKTAEGDDASGVFVNMLKTCGARVSPGGDDRH